MENFGARVTYSVFECHLEAESLALLKQRLAELIEPAADNVRHYVLCDGCVKKIEVQGKGEITRNLKNQLPWQGLSFEEREKDAGDDADLADPEDEHPFDKRSLDHRKAFLKLFLYKGVDILACAVVDPAEEVHQSVGAVVPKLFS